jgi:hypothetical protein
MAELVHELFVEQPPTLPWSPEAYDYLIHIVDDIYSRLDQVQSSPNPTLAIRELFPGVVTNTFTTGYQTRGIASLEYYTRIAIAALIRNATYRATMRGANTVTPEDVTSSLSIQGREWLRPYPSNVVGTL